MNNNPNKPRILLPYVLLLGLVLAACDRVQPVSVPNAGIAARSEWLSLCPDFAQTGKAPLSQNAQCGRLWVSENPQDPQSKKIALNVLRIPAVNPVPEPNPLFVIAGGPGQAAVEVAESMYALFGEVRKNRDIVFVDQRGTGQSNPLPCELARELGAKLTRAEQEALERAALKRCIASIAPYAAYYTTPYAVQDLDAVRAALGYETINLWGGSYGSRVVLEYLRRYPEHTRASVIDGVAPVAIALPWSMEADALAALQAINQQCAATPECRANYGDIVEKAQAVARRLEENPQAITIMHPRTQAKITVNIAAQDFSGVIRLALYSRDLAALLPQVISSASSGDYAVLAALMHLATAKSEMAGINYALHYTVICNEDYPLYKDKMAESTNVFLTTNVFLKTKMVQTYAEICAQWPRAPLPADYWQPIRSDLPVLALSGAVDPVTPPYWAELVRGGLPNLTALVAPGGHHIISAEGCTAQLISAFIAKGDGKALDARCIQNIQPLAIHLPPSAMAQASSAAAQPSK